MVDLTLLQPISWFAASIGVCVAAFYYVLVLREQRKNTRLSLETRQAQLFMQVFNRYHEEGFWKNYLSYMSMEWKSYDDWERDRSDLNLFSTRLSIGTYLEGVAVLVKRGLLSPDLVADILGSTVVRYWKKQADYVKEFRIRADYPQYLEYVEYLSNEVLKLRGSEFMPKWIPVGAARGSQG